MPTANLLNSNETKNAKCAFFVFILVGVCYICTPTNHPPLTSEAVMEKNELDELLAEAFNEGFNEGQRATKKLLLEMLKDLLKEAEDLDAGDI